MQSLKRPGARVSVIIVNYNAGEWLRPCVTAALTAANEIVVVDNASTDDSLCTLESLGTQITVVRRSNNDGLSCAVNEGAQYCSGDYLLLLNPDCLLQSNTIDGLLAEFDAHPDAGIVGPLIFNSDGSEQRGGRRNEPNPWRALMRSMPFGKLRQTAGYDLHEHDLPSQGERVDAVSGSCLLIERGLFDQLKGMDTDYFLHFEDLDLCRRARQQSRWVRFVPGVFAVHAQGVSSAAHPYWIEIEKHRSMLRYYAKFYRPSHPLTRAMAYAVISAGVLFRLGLVLARIALNSLRHSLRRRVASAQPAPDSIPQTQRAMATFFGSTENHDSDRHNPAVLIVGAASLVGGYVMEQAVERSYKPYGFTRNRQVPSELHHLDLLMKGPTTLFADTRYAIHLAPVWTLADYIQRYAQIGVTHLIGLSSSSLDSKRLSADAKDQALAKRLEDAETVVLEQCRYHQIEVTLFRPTMIFDVKADNNIGFIYRMIRRWGFFPLIGEGHGLRQPVYAGDIASACWQRLAQRANWREQVVHLPGGESLSYRSMVENIFMAMQRRPRFIRVPESVMVRLLKTLSWLPGCGFLSAGMAHRMSEDLCYPIQPAQHAFDYCPQKFSTVIHTLIQRTRAGS